ncbi:MAG: hypothetical protein PWP23_2211 [Candidatus Sumerlaeota bacterium]|nr:hypothetical protein [Candidatus Sumerlaeota bacterium]
MRPLHIRTKQDYIRQIQACLDREDNAQLADVVGQAFEDYHDEEDFASWCASVAHGNSLAGAPTLQARFLEDFPASLHPIQVDWAEHLIWQGRIDEASNEARAYLSRIHAAGLSTWFERHDLVRDGCSRAFLLLTAVYSEAGARSYSRRVIEQAMLLDLEPFWQQRFQAEYRRISDERADANLSQLDALWESFFQRGEGLPALLDLCARCRLPILARRIETLARHFEETPGWKPGDDEIFQMLYRTEQGAFVLV